jgi:hypothetical protein
MERLGAVQANVHWSWCAVNEKKRKVYFSIWTYHVFTHNGSKGYIIQEPDTHTGSKSAARNDQDRKFALVFEQGYEPWGYFIVARDRTVIPHEIEETRTSFVVRLELTKLPDGTIFCKIVERVEIR